MSSAYDKAMALKLAQKQAEQRAITPRKVAQNLLREWCGRASGFGASIDVMAAGRLVELVEAVVVAERARIHAAQNIQSSRIFLKRH